MKRGKITSALCLVSDGLTCGAVCMYRGETLPDGTEKQHDVLFRSQPRTTGAFPLADTVLLW